MRAVVEVAVMRWPLIFSGVQQFFLAHVKSKRIDSTEN